jgi:hypothetical protein
MAIPTLTRFEGSKAEILALINALPDDNYRLEIIRVVSAEEAKRNLESNPALMEAIARMSNRTEEEVLADRARIMAKSRKPRPLPEGKTLDDVVRGKWPGDETDEEILKALEELS